MYKNEKFKRLIFLVEIHFSKVEYEFFGIDFLQSQGFDVEVWDFTNYIQPNIPATIVSSYNYSNLWQLHKVFSNKDQVQKAFARLGRSSFIVSYLTYSSASLFVYKIMAKCKLPYALVSRNQMPLFFYDDSISFLKRMLNVCGSRFFARLESFIMRKIPYFILRVRAADFLFLDVQRVGIISPVGKGTKVIYHHSPDYDYYLLELAKNKKNSSSDNLAIFLDQYIPFHHDFLCIEGNYSFDVKEYYLLLRNFFNYLEIKYKIKIIIALHPRAEQQERKGWFGNREVIKNNTVELVSNCQFVMAHFSTAISYAVLFKKPLLFLKTTHFLNNRLDKYCQMLARYLGSSLVNISTPKEYCKVDIMSNLNVDVELYENYKSKYIKYPGTKDTLFWQNFIEQIKKY